MLIPGPNQNGFTSTGDEDILFMVDRDTLFGENGNSVVVSETANTDKGGGKVVKRVGACGT
jgi:hypothetical protein